MEFNFSLQYQFSHIQEQKNSVDNLKESGIIKENKRKTDEKPIISKNSANFYNVGSNTFSDNARIKMYQCERGLADNKYETAVVYKSNGEILFTKKGTDDEVIFTESELGRIRSEGCVLTHNHPKATIPSAYDINTLRSTGINEIRTSNKYSVYIIKHTGKWNKNIDSLDKIKKEHNKAISEVWLYYRDIATKEGTSILKYLDEIDVKGMRLFADRFGLEFRWEEEPWQK